MAIRIQYQNNVTGAAFDITTLVSGAKWSTKRSGSPASLELTAIVNDEIQWSHGGIVTLLDDKTGLFYGYVVKISQNEKGTGSDHGLRSDLVFEEKQGHLCFQGETCGSGIEADRRRLQIENRKPGKHRIFYTVYD